MFDCHRRYPWNPEYECPKRGLFGRCVRHHLERVRFDWRSAHFYLSVDLDNLNRPQLHVDDDRPIGYASLDFGSSGCDPVVSIGWQRTPLRRES